MTTTDVEVALATARYLAECGVPIFVAKLTDGGGISTSWKNAKADPSVVDHWKPGMALCAVMGHVLDAIDIDPRNGGSLAALEAELPGGLPRIYGVAHTPSGGEHYLVATMGVRKVGNIVPGVDIQAGVEGEGRGILFLAPTVRESKVTGVDAGYVWELEPDLGMLMVEEDITGRELAALVEARHERTKGSVDAEGDYDGPAYHELTEELQAEADAHCEGLMARWKGVFAEALEWPEGYYVNGRGWEALARDFAWALAKMAACPWMALDATGAELQYHEVLPDELADARGCQGKWYAGIVEKASSDPVDLPPWVLQGDPADDFGRVRPLVDVTNDGTTGRWLDDEMGTGPLSGLFRRGNDLIYTPRVGEDGYIPAEEGHDGPAQVKRMSPLQLAKRIDKSYRVVRTVGGRNARQELTVFPELVAKRSMSLLDELRTVQELRIVTHTPIVRADGTVLNEPGYDEASGALYLPDPGLVVPTVSEVPTAAELKQAVDLVLGEMLCDFPFVTPHDRANYLGSMLTPLLRVLVPPTYKMLIIGAPQRGSGKTKLADLLRTLHGGVFRAEMPGGNNKDEELRKVISSILDGTSAPVVVFDNVSGLMKSSVLDGLLTSAEWTDRRLGVNENIVATNDRLWVVTGNNVHIAGDLERRVLWCTIDAGMEQPEKRPASSFRHPDVDRWAAAQRGELLWALLTWVRAWAAEGMPLGAEDSSDDFGVMTQTLRGVLGVAGIDGEVGHVATAPQQVDPDAEEHSSFLRAVVRVMGSSEWTVRELLDKASKFAGDDGLRYEDLPGDVSSRLERDPGTALKSLGRWLSYRNDRVRDDLVIRKRGSGKSALKWRVEAN